MAKKEIDNQSGDAELGRFELRAGEHWLGVILGGGTVRIQRVYEPGTGAEMLIPLQDGQWTASEVRLVKVAAKTIVAVVGSEGASGVTVWRE